MTADPNAIAIIGMSGAFPGARDIDELWARLRVGEVLTERLSAEQMRAAGIPASILDDPDYVALQALPEHFDCFDAEFFGVAPSDAATMDPQHRLLLEHAYRALESAGYAPTEVPGLAGLFVGVGLNSYLLHYRDQLMQSQRDSRSSGNVRAMLGNEKSYAATRIAYRLNLRGPCMSVDVACSTSLVAVHLACTSLLGGECDVALAGGARISVPVGTGYLAEAGGIHAPNGRCAPFDELAQGTVPANGVGIVVLKRLADALADRDPVRAVILATAVNNDGNAKMDYAAPSVEGQSAVIRSALALAAVDPADIQYIETHGTGTAIGDPLEIAALDVVLRGARKPRQHRCKLGAVKANVGHLDVAAGVTGLIKTVCALEAAEIPPLANFTAPNPRLDLDRVGLEIPTAPQPWPESAAGRIAGVSSFGIGGTNAHAVLRAAAHVEPARQSTHWCVLPLSARTPDALQERARQLGQHLAAAQPALADAAFTLQCGRDALPLRAFVVANGTADAAALLANDAGAILAAASVIPAERPGVAFLFPGQGTSHAGIAASLHGSVPLFRAHLDAVVAHAGAAVGDYLLTPAAAGAKPDAGDEIVQGALFAFQYALAKTLIDLGVRPDCMLGHSLGEYVAACIAGVFSLEHAVTLVRARGRAMAGMPPGAMLAVAMSEDAARAFLRQEAGLELDLSAINGAEQCVLGGDESGVERASALLTARAIPNRRLAVAHAFHSRHADAVLGEFAHAFSGVTLNRPRIALAANVLGRRADTEFTSSDYWLRHLREPVRFSDGLAEMCGNRQPLIVEIGAGQVLSGLARAQRVSRVDRFVPLQPPVNETADSSLYGFCQGLGRLWQQGIAIGWNALYAQQRPRRLRLPTYPFARTRYWPDDSRVAAGANASSPVALPGVAQLVMPTWWREPAPVNAQSADGRLWVVLADDVRQGEALRDALSAAGITAIDARDSREPRDYSLDGLRTMWQTIVRDHAPAAVHAVFVHGETDGAADLRQRLEARFADGFLALLHLAQTAVDVGIDLRLSVVASRLFSVSGEGIDPTASLLLGAVRVIPLEYGTPPVRIVEIPAASIASGAMLQRVVAELRLDENAAPSVALRERSRWVEAFKPIDPAPAATVAVRSGARYVILGGTGAIGRKVAQLLVRGGATDLVLVGRRELPAREQWRDIAATDSALAPLLRDFLALESAGCRLDLRAVDLRDIDGVCELLRPLEGVAGIVHAAGIPGVGISRFKSLAAMRDVLDSKIAPLLAIERCVDIARLDFLLLCSSTTALVGGPGQADYAAANAFLDAYAVSRAGDGRVISVGWDKWEQVGMAQSTTAASRRVARLQDFSCPLPSWTAAARAVAARAGGAQSCRVQMERDWCLREHAILGRAVLPGMAFVEMLANIAKLRGSGALAARSIEWVAPAWADAADGVDLAFESADEPGGTSIRMRDAKPGLELLYANAILVDEPGDPWAATDSLPAIRARCTEVVLDPAQDFRRTLFAELGESVIDLGPRWNALRAVHRGAKELLVEACLPPPAVGDLAHFIAHPALLDAMALAAPLLLDRRSDLFVPSGIESVWLRDSLPAAVSGWVRIARSTADEIAFDVTLFDPQGNCLGGLRGLTLRRSQLSVPARLPEERGLSAANEIPGLTEVEALGFLPAILSQDLVHVVVSRLGVPATRALLQRAVLPRVAEEKADEVMLTGDSVTPLQRVLARLWSQELGRKAFELDENFFSLGGTSLAAMQIVNAVQRQYDCRLPTRALFDFPTLRSLSECVERAVESRQGANPQAIRRVTREGVLPLSQQQRALWFLSSMQDDAATYNIPISFSLRGTLRVADLLRALARVIDRHEPLRTQFLIDSDVPSQRVLEHAEQQVPVIDLSALPVERRRAERDRLLAVNAHARFDWLQGPLYRVWLLRLGADEHVVVACVHHAISDHWSIGIFVADWLRSYVSGAALPALPLQHIDFVAHQERDAGKQRGREHLDYWRRQLADAPDSLALPCDFARPDVASARGATERAWLTAATYESLERLAVRRSITPYVVLLAAFKAVLFGLSGERRIVVGTPVANRPDEQLRDVIGFFANTIALYSVIDPQASFAQLLQTVRDTAYAGFERQDVPFDRVIDALGRSGSLKHSPLFQVVFALQNAPLPQVDLQGLELHPLASNTDTAKFDLTIMLYPDAGGLRLEAEYRTDLFRATTIRGILDLYSEVLGRIALEGDHHTVSELLSRSRVDAEQEAPMEELLI